MHRKASFDQRILKAPHLQELPLSSGSSLLYNSLWPQPVRASEGVVRLLDLASLTPGPLPPTSDVLREIMDTLVRHKLAFPAKESESEILEKRQADWMERARRGSLVRTLLLNLDTRCNLACSYCNVMKTQAVHPALPRAPMSLDTAKTAIDGFVGILERCNTAFGRVVLFGGEPLMNRGVAVQTAEYARARFGQRTLSLSINTNGLLLNAETAKRLRQAACTIAISIDGPAALQDRYRHGPDGQPSFERTVRALRTAISEKCVVVVLSTLNPDSFKCLPDFMDFLLAEGVEHWCLKLPTFCEAGSEIYNSQEIPRWARCFVATVREARRRGLSMSGLPEPKFSGCEGIGAMLSVEPDGTVYPCPGGIQLRLGDLSTLPKVTESEAYLHVASRTLATLPECRDCLVGGYCAGSCAADAERSSGSLFRANPEICRFMKELVLEHLTMPETQP